MSKIKFSIRIGCLAHERIIEMENAFASFKKIEINLYVHDTSDSSAEKISHLLNSLNSLQKLILRPPQSNFDSLLKLVKLLPEIPWTIYGKNEMIIYQKINTKENLVV